MYTPLLLYHRIVQGEGVVFCLEGGVFCLEGGMFEVEKEPVPPVQQQCTIPLRAL